MANESPKAVMLGDAAAYVRLSRYGYGHPEDGIATAIIEVKGGPFTGSVHDDSLVGINVFCNDLSRLYDQLIGSATLRSLEKFTMTCEGDGRGAITVSVELYGAHVPLSKLCFEMTVDQTYLPQFIKDLRAEFTDG